VLGAQKDLFLSDCRFPATQLISSLRKELNAKLPILPIQKPAEMAPALLPFAFTPQA
jgi:hypothetical protein